MGLIAASFSHCCTRTCTRTHIEGKRERKGGRQAEADVSCLFSCRLNSWSLCTYLPAAVGLTLSRFHLRRSSNDQLGRLPISAASETPRLAMWLMTSTPYRRLPFDKDELKWHRCKVSVSPTQPKDMSLSDVRIGKRRKLRGCGSSLADVVHRADTVTLSVGHAPAR